MSAHDKRIAFFTSSFNVGGVERAFVSLANGFAKDGYKVDFLVCYNTGQIKDQVDPKINIVDFGSWRLRTSFIKLFWYLKKKKIPTLITGPTYPNIIAIICNLLNFSKTKVIITQHNYQDAEMEKLGIVGKIAPTLTKRFYPFAHQIVSVSDSVKRDLIQNYNIKPEKITTIFNAVIDDSFYERESQSLSADLKLPDEPYIVAVGRLQPIKNYEFMLRSFKELTKIANFNYKLVIVGDGIDMDSLTKLAAELNIADVVYFLGSVTNPLPIIKRARLLIHTSRSESMGIVYVETLQSKVPIVTLANQGANEILKDISQVTIVPQDDIQLFNQAIIITLEKTNFGDFPSLDKFKTENVLSAFRSIIN